MTAATTPLAPSGSFHTPQTKPVRIKGVCCPTCCQSKYNPYHRQRSGTHAYLVRFPDNSFYCQGCKHAFG